MCNGLAALAIVVILLAISCEQIYLLKQIKKALDFQAIEVARQSIYLQKLTTHAEVSRSYLQHISRRTRALQGATEYDSNKNKQDEFYSGTITSEDRPG